MNTWEFELDMNSLPQEIVNSLKKLEKSVIRSESWTPPRNELVTLYGILKEIVKFSQKHIDLTMKIGNYISSALIFNRNLDEETDEIVPLFGQLDLPEHHTSWWSRQKVKEEILKLINEYKTNKFLIN